MKSRRNFIKQSLLASVSAPLITGFEDLMPEANKTASPIIISTWKNINANKAAWESLSNQGTILDAVEQGVRVPEADPNDHSVGYGGFPDRDGNVTLDASIMDGFGNAGAVLGLKHIKHPVTVARLVMEQTPHVYLVDQGAYQFALKQGFLHENLLTEYSIKAWKKWLETSDYKPKINAELHDTIGMLVLGNRKNIVGACSTSGLAYKMAGRVGDSPIVGAGLYVDNEVGAATATGLGEAIIKKVGSFSIVEMMRNGMSPQNACEKAIKRLTSLPGYKDFQVAYIAINMHGQYGAFSLHPGFEYTISKDSEHKVYTSKSLLTI